MDAAILAVRHRHVQCRGVNEFGACVQVNRVRNKWKIALKQGIVHIDGHEYVFAKANCEFIF